jgi:hypothetical protein
MGRDACRLGMFHYAYFRRLAQHILEETTLIKPAFEVNQPDVAVEKISRINISFLFVFDQRR